ncbi:flagellar biosynthesis protein FlgD [Polymorphobacter sp. PAMC 29334]|uniref:flagellar hook assembly protein FlgD n=1 Tax=Polymorphobacter sp. PAMC 29334 TaxID=2862331 RepID=UPI001C769416|nr:flagellar hook capping FlgD N-terminal domain-containing protein [Polymorphobacter sp. PAMC 29334]QYE36554.1 flagellar biosynthesis protein FlgD [Polymorphobacter sp. PAMC 29334]
MTDPIAGVRSAVTGTVPANRTTLGQSDFLALMTAQLKNQDPTKPVDNSEYVTQLAQLSTVTGISETNVDLTSIATKLDTLIAAGMAKGATA